MADNSNRTSNLGPRVSHVTTKAYNGPGHYLVPSWMTFEVDGLTKLETVNIDGTITSESDSALNFSGNVHVTGPFALGASGTSFSALRRSTISVTPGAVAPFDSVSTTATISLMPADAIVIAAQPGSLWSGAYYDLAITARVSAASTLVIGLANSTLTSVTPAAMNWDVVYLDPS